jgi:hypothetical protein
MSLDYQFEKIENWKDVCWEEKPNGKVRIAPDTEILIWASMVVDLGTITPQNAAEWRYRMLVLERIDSAVGVKDGAAYTPSLKTIKQHVGLYTNVVNRTRRQWWARIKQRLDNELDNQIKREESDE